MKQKLVLFVHGLGGESESTWGAFPELLRSDPDIRNCDIGYFSYPTSLFRIPFSRKAPRIQSLAGALQTIVENRYSNYGDILLVCHSLGGLIGKQYLIDQIDQQRPLRVKSMLLFAVPNNGAGLASVAACISWRHGQLRQLCRESDLVRNLATMWQRRQMAEKVDVRYVVAGLDRVVDEFSARDSWGNVAVDVVADHDHRSIVKPRLATDLSYLILRNTLLHSAIASAPTPSLPHGRPNEYIGGAVLQTSPQQEIRVAMSALLRIASGDSYVLIRNLHRPESFGPIGGAYKYFPDAQGQLDSFDFRAQSVDADMVGDIRGFLQFEHLERFCRWFEEGKGRETGYECLQRELREELIETGVEVDAQELTDVRFKYVRTVREGPEPLAAESYHQYRIFDVYDLVPMLERGHDLVRKIHANAALGENMIRVTSHDIIRGRDRLRNVIGSHSPYLFGQKRYRSQDPAFIVA